MTIWPHYGEKRRTTLSTQQPSSSAKQLITLGEHSFQQTVFFCFPMSPSSHTHWSGKMTRLQGMNIGGRVSVSNLLWHACKHALHEQLRHCNTQKCRILHTLPRSVNDLHTFSTKIRKKKLDFHPFLQSFWHTSCFFISAPHHLSSKLPPKSLKRGMEYKPCVSTVVLVTFFRSVFRVHFVE